MGVEHAHKMSQLIFHLYFIYITYYTIIECISQQKDSHHCESFYKSLHVPFCNAPSYNKVENHTLNKLCAFINEMYSECTQKVLKSTLHFRVYSSTSTSTSTKI